MGPFWPKTAPYNLAVAEIVFLSRSVERNSRTGRTWAQQEALRAESSRFTGRSNGFQLQCNNTGPVQFSTQWFCLFWTQEWWSLCSFIYLPDSFWEIPSAQTHRVLQVWALVRFQIDQRNVVILTLTNTAVSWNRHRLCWMTGLVPSTNFLLVRFLRQKGKWSPFQRNSQSRGRVKIFPFCSSQQKQLHSRLQAAAAKSGTLIAPSGIKSSWIVLSTSATGT